MTLIHNPSGITLQAPIGVFFSQSDIKRTLDKLIEKAELMIVRNDDAFFNFLLASYRSLTSGIAIAIAAFIQNS